MITGSLASTYYGRPRTTQDVDLVIEPDPGRLVAFVAAARHRGYYVNENDATDALSHRSMFNVIDASSGYKLEWSREAGSDRQFLDALGIALSQGDSLDGSYLARWAKELDLTTALNRLLSEVRRQAGG